MAGYSFRCRQIDKYDGQYIFCGTKIVYDLGNYLGGGASGSVYQAVDSSSVNVEKSVAIKILNPLGYKNTVVGQINKCVVAVKGQQLNTEQIHAKMPMLAENVWWLVHPTSKVVFAAYEDPHRMQLRELPLPKCVEIWGLNPLGFDFVSDNELEKLNMGTSCVTIDNCNIRIPVVSPKYLKFLRSRQSVCREMSNMVQIGEHPNIVDLLEVLELIQDTKSTLFLVLELVNGGELFERMKAGGVCSSEEFARRYFVQLLSGINYCHQKGVVHRDLKPENLLLSDPSDTAILKIADFGLSAIVFAAESFACGSSGHQDSKESKETSGAGRSDKSKPINNLQCTQAGGTTFLTPTKTNQNMLYLPVSGQLLGPPVVGVQQSDCTPGGTLRRLKSVVGSPHYIAPEIGSNDPAGYDGRKVDMWSSGVILYSLLTGTLPFGSDIASCPRFKRYKQWMNSDYLSAIKEGKEPPVPNWFLPSPISQSVGSLLVGLLQCDPAARLTAREAIKHPWCVGGTCSDKSSASSATTVERILFGNTLSFPPKRQDASSISAEEQELSASLMRSASVRTVPSRRSPVGRAAEKKSGSREPSPPSSAEHLDRL